MCKQIEDSTSLYVEALALKKGCNLTLILETDSLSLTKIVKGDWECPWSIVMLIKKIKELVFSDSAYFQRGQQLGGLFS